MALQSHIGTHGTPFCRSHNPKVAGSNPAPAMRRSPAPAGLFRWLGTVGVVEFVPISYQFVGTMTA